MFKLSFKNLIQWVLIVIIGYQLAFTWFPLWYQAFQLNGLDVSHMVIEDETGKRVPISHFKGNPLIINFWATWCVSCRIELPLLNGIYPSLSDKKKQLIGLNYGESWELIQRFRGKTDIDFPVYRGSGKLSEMLNIRVIPAIAVIDENGKIESITYGFRPWIQAYLLWWV